MYNEYIYILFTNIRGYKAIKNCINQEKIPNPFEIDKIQDTRIFITNFRPT